MKRIKKHTLYQLWNYYLVDPIPNLPNYHDKNCTEDTKERDLVSERVKNHHCLPVAIFSIIQHWLSK